MNKNGSFIDVMQGLEVNLPRLSDIRFYPPFEEKYRGIEGKLKLKGRAATLPEYIYFEYHFNKRSVNSLADEFEVSGTNLIYLMGRLGIPRRSLEEAMSGENNPMYGKKGPDHPWFGQKHTKKSLKIMDQKLRAYWEREANNTC